MVDQQHKSVYSQQSLQYDRLVEREDYQQALPEAVKRILPISNSRLLDLGAGTGRFAAMFGLETHELMATDAAHAMLRVTAEKMKSSGVRHWGAVTADHRSLPFVDGHFDAVISGWSVCYLVSWHEASWQAEVKRALQEIHRVLKPGGSLLIVETLGTGYESPYRLPHLAPYYEFLEGEGGFKHTWIRTDYRFSSTAEAEELVRFFFGDELAERVKRDRQTIVPECTGLWWRTF